jgi:hypothetical protein
MTLVGTAVHATHGADLPVFAVPLSLDRMAMYAVRGRDGRALVMGTMAALADKGYRVTWNLPPARRWPQVPQE